MTGAQKCSISRGCWQELVGVSVKAWCRLSCDIMWGVGDRRGERRRGVGVGAARGRFGLVGTVCGGALSPSEVAAVSPSEGDDTGAGLRMGGRMPGRLLRVTRGWFRGAVRRFAGAVGVVEVCVTGVATL